MTRRAKKIFIIISSCIVIVAMAGLAVVSIIFKPLEGPRIIGTIKSMTIKEKDIINDYGINQNIKLKIFLPKNYDAGKKYPIIYLLDGDSLFKAAAGYLSEMIEKNPDKGAILVGIGYGYYNSYLAKFGQGRWRDYTFKEDPQFSGIANGPNFYKFLSEKLVPDIQKIYKADTSKSTLMGHSTGGDFTYYAFLQYDPSKKDANPFANFIVADGGDEKHFVDVWMPEFEKRMQQNSNAAHQTITLYRVYGYLVNPDNLYKIEDLHKWLEGKNYKEIEAYRYYPLNDDHGATMKTFIVNGLKMVLEDKEGFLTYDDESSFNFE